MLLRAPTLPLTLSALFGALVLAITAIYVGGVPAVTLGMPQLDLAPVGFTEVG